MDRFNNGFRSLDVYMYMQFYYKYVILMMCFNTVFGDTPSSVYGIYVVLHVVDGQAYVDVTPRLGGSTRGNRLVP